MKEQALLHCSSHTVCPWDQKTKYNLVSPVCGRYAYLPDPLQHILFTGLHHPCPRAGLPELPAEYSAAVFSIEDIQQVLPLSSLYATRPFSCKLSVHRLHRTVNDIRGKYLFKKLPCCSTIKEYLPIYPKEKITFMSDSVLDACIYPNGDLDVLSRLEISRLLDTSQGELYPLFRSCSLAVLNYGEYLDNGKELLERFASFDIRVMQEERGIKLCLTNAPQDAFVDGEMIRGIRENLFAVLRDIIYADNEIHDNPKFDLNVSDDITNAVFHILRNANIMKPRTNPRLVVCWGGHSIPEEEYDYTKEVGYQLGLRGMDICTGCGPGAMKGPMKGAAIAHAKQRNYTGQYLGITEPGIIAAESPNPIVNSLVIMPDIEKRLEAFVRTGHGIIVFPGGVGTAEEILYLLGILMAPQNKHLPFPVVFTGPASAAAYFEQIDAFIGATLGPEAQQRYTIMIDEPELVALTMKDGIERVRQFRKLHDDAYYYNWLLHIDPGFQKPFIPTHENMASLDLSLDQEKHLLAVNLRRAFSGIVAGNVKEAGIRAIEEKGLFELKGDCEVMEPLDKLLRDFIASNRMKLSTQAYSPCYSLHS